MLQSFRGDMIVGIKIEVRPVTPTTPVLVTYRLTILASAVPEIFLGKLGPQNLKWVTWPRHMPLRVIYHQYAGTWHSHMCSKCDHYSFNRFRDIVGVHQNLHSLRDHATPRLWMICYPWLALATVNLTTNLNSLSSPTTKTNGQADERAYDDGIIIPLLHRVTHAVKITRYRM